MQKLFGTDGIRGEAGIFPLDEKTIKTIGKALAKRFTNSLNGQPRFVVGRDTRESGEWIEKAFISGAKKGGAACQSAGVITTPGVAFLTKNADFDAGIVISASHNPFNDNGVKIFLPSGKKLDESAEREIEKEIFKNNEALSDSSPVDTSKSESFQRKYIDNLANRFKSLNLSGFTIVLDCANGAASNLAPLLFETLGASVIAINNTPDGRNINLDCGSLHLEHLQRKVLEENADIGVGFDGDADRSLFVDGAGGLVDGDATLWVLAQHLKNHGDLANDTVVATVMSNLGLEIAFNSKNIKLLRTAVGDKYVLRELLATGSSIGGEQSGHIILPEHSLVGDGMQTALFLLESLFESGKSLVEAKEGFTQFPQILVNVRVKEKTPFDEIDAIYRATKELEAELGETGRLLLRYSGTENLARVMIEGKDQEEIEAQASDLAKIIEESLG